jgi:hypothetical protein
MTMGNEQVKIRSIVRRENAEGYLLTSLVAFAVAVIFTRAFLQLTGFPQLGNSVLHIAHALWGGLLLFIAVLLPLALANRWAFQASAVLSGLGIGLFIDEVGKFITQTNDYFFAPALSLIYGFFLLCVFLYLLLRRSHQENPRRAMYHAFDGLQDALDGDLDSAEAAKIEAQLAVARRSDREEIVSLATVLGTFLEKEKGHLPQAKPNVWKRTATRVDALGLRLGRRMHRTIISGILILWLVIVIGYVVVLIQGGPNLDEQVVQWSGILIGIQAMTGCLMLAAVLGWVSKNEEWGLKFGISGFLLSLVALQLHYFYISQFSAITATLLQFGFLQILLAYRRWYLSDSS